MNIEHTKLIIDATKNQTLIVVTKNQTIEDVKSIYDLVKTSFENKRINTATAEKLLNEVEEKMLTSAIRCKYVLVTKTIWTLSEDL